MFHGNVNVNSIEENATRIKIEIMINVGANVKKNIVCAKEIIIGILLHVVMKMVNM